MPTSTLPRSRIAAPASTSSSPSVCGLVAACIRDRVSGKRTTPIAAVNASVEPPSTSTAVTMSSAFIATSVRSRDLAVSGTRNRATLTEPTKLINDSAVRPYVTVVSRLKAAQVPIAHIVTATNVSNATSRSSVLGPASIRNIVIVAAADSITAATIHTTFMRTPCRWTAASRCRVRTSPPVGARSVRPGGRTV